MLSNTLKPQLLSSPALLPCSRPEAVFTHHLKKGLQFHQQCKGRHEKFSLSRKPLKTVSLAFIEDIFINS